MDDYPDDQRGSAAPNRLRNGLDRFDIVLTRNVSVAVMDGLVR